ncbi:hypothetical protein [Dyadobacter sandarakinus]|uniref:Lipoprotein n=1 Tax=Dyadobacter sandarakinus TaxID=2747268 RepID=A0ABX7I449_9BACT|nr:hypothetical protein [Dyadobacter sandarakinus]QRR00645.1 hypothetical protein HWI92_06850 [Dyadobacter sandarakinus]
MFNKLLGATLASVLLVAGCAPKVRTNITQKYPPLHFSDQVVVIPKTGEAPAGAEVLGTLHVGDAGMTTNCSYTVVIGKAKEEARKTGGNAIRVTQHKKPDFMSSCHRITAEVLRLSNDQLAVFRDNEAEIDSLLDHAVLYVYRDGGPGVIVNYNISLGDSVICRVSPKSRQKIEIRKEGDFELWAKTESKASIPVNFVKGKTYYLRCGVAMGIMVGRPTLDLVDRATGKSEYFAKRK